MRVICLLLGMAALGSVAGCPTGDLIVPGNPRVRIETTLGSFVVELFPGAAPVAVQNFQQYASDGFYDGTLFHRVIPGFVIQGGGFTTGLVEKDTRPAIINEARQSAPNVRGTIAMARGDDPNSATSQFFINLVDNAALDPTLTSAGYAVFGIVVEGMDVVDTIATARTQTADNGFEAVPVTDIVILSAIAETGPASIDPEWQAYLDDFEFRAANFVRSSAIQIGAFLVSSRGF
ncbi:Peptidyl-prolyl cis-trans isomerase A precursor [Phycisphaerae bacterium RAS1]|nr:Peptidyl-prolyl cis-trans isomerase A precursor [Phycisphaerae bacterium RAS1]